MNHRVEDHRADARPLLLALLNPYAHVLRLFEVDPVPGRFPQPKRLPRGPQPVRRPESEDKGSQDDSGRGKRKDTPNAEDQRHRQ